jgi:hypothetical protein
LYVHPASIGEYLDIVQLYLRGKGRARLILFLLMAVPQQGGKAILNAGVPNVDLYLDGKYAAITDEKGMLTMESFP